MGDGMGDGMWQSGFGVVIVWAPFWWEFISLKIDGLSFKILLKFPWNFFFGFFVAIQKSDWNMIIYRYFISTTRTPLTIYRSALFYIGFTFQLQPGSLPPTAMMVNQWPSLHNLQWHLSSSPAEGFRIGWGQVRYCLGPECGDLIKIIWIPQIQWLPIGEFPWCNFSGRSLSEESLVAVCPPKSPISLPNEKGTENFGAQGPNNLMKHTPESSGKKTMCILKSHDFLRPKISEGLDG